MDDLPAPDFAPDDGVVYRPYPGAPGEDGTVVRWNDSGTMVFVLFVGDRTPKECRPEDLERPGVARPERTVVTEAELRELWMRPDVDTMGVEQQRGVRWVQLPDGTEYEAPIS